MKKFLLLLTLLVSHAIVGYADNIECLFTSSLWNATSSYSGNNSIATSKDGVWKIVGANNNGTQSSKWDYIKICAKGTSTNPTTQTAEIQRITSVDKAISSVAINITNFSTNGTISAYDLYISDDSTFDDKDIIIRGTVPTAAGTASITIPNPQKNKYYAVKITATNKGSAGVLTIDKFTLSVSDTVEPNPVDPDQLGDIKATTDAGEVTNGGNVTIALGESITFSAENAEEILVECDDLDFMDTVDGTWTPDGICENALVEVVASKEGEEAKDFKFYLTVTKPKTAVTLSYNPTSATINLGESFTAPSFSVVDADGNAVTDAPIKYESSNSAVLSVDENGVLTAHTSVVGSATIKATLEENGKYTSKTVAEYTLTISDPNITFTDVIQLNTFSKVKAEKSSTTYTDDSYSSPNGITYTVKLANGNSSMQFNANDNYGIAVTGNSNGYVIKKITFEFQSGTSNGRIVNVYGCKDVYTALNQMSTEGSVIGTIVNGTNDNLVSTENYKGVGFHTSSGAAYVSKITFEWGMPLAGKTEPELGFAKDFYTVDINDEFTAPVLNNKDNVAVTWSSSNKNIADIDATSGAITLKKFGTTTITATFDGDDSHFADNASYILEVTDRNITTYTFDFISNDYGMTRHTDGSEYNPKTYVFSDKWIGAKIVGRSRLWSDKGLRMYSEALLTIHMPENCEIVEAKVLSENNAEVTSFNNKITYSEDSPVVRLYNSNSNDFDVPKVAIYYKNVSDEDIENAFTNSTVFLLNGEIYNGDEIQKTAEADAKIELSHHYPHAKVYTKWEAQPKAQAPGLVTLALEGFEEHTAPLSLATAGTLSYYAELNGLTTPVQSLTVSGDNTTSISEVGVGADNSEEWYDLAGRRVVAPANGIYIKKHGNAVTKHMVK